MNIFRYILGCSLAGAAMLTAQQPASTTQPPAGPAFRFMGPSVGNRIASAAGVPGDPTVYYAGAASGGLWKSSDGGRTWTRSLFADPMTGCSGLTMDPKDPNVLFAGMWQAEMHTWGELSGGPGSAIYVTRDGGAKWTKVTHPGLPTSPLGKIDVAIAPTDSSRIYALIQTADPGSPC